MTISVDSEGEAYYLAGMLGNVISQFVAAGSTPVLSTTTKILDILPIPPFNDRSSSHLTMASESRRAHELSSQGRDLSDVTKAIDSIAASVYGVPEESIDSIRDSYESLL